MKTFTTLAACLTTVVVASGSAYADHRPSLTELACLLRDQAAAVDRELVEDFPGTLQFRQMRAYTVRIGQTAARIENSGRHPNIHLLMHDIEDLALDMRVLEALVAELNSPLSVGHGHGHFSAAHLPRRPLVDPECIARLTVLVSNMSDTIAQMGSLVLPQSAKPIGHDYLPPVDSHRVPVFTSPATPIRAPVLPVVEHEPTIRFGNGKFAFSLSIR